MSDEIRGDPELRAWLRERIRTRGSIPFVEFMEAALYHPSLGYYCREGATTGPEGDFYTSPDLHPAFGLLLSRQITEIARVTGADPGASFHVIEMGPGSGRLARDILNGLASEQPELAQRVTCTLVEISPSLRRAQREATNTAGLDAAGAHVGWARWSDLLERRHEGGFAGCVVANEFLDALPVHLVERRGASLKEVHVELDGEDFREILLEPTTARIEEHLTELGVDLSDGQRAEVGLRALDWVSSLERLFGERGRGGAVIVDYGHAARDLYDASRHRGTLMCYSKHRAVEDPYARVGQQDMTAHVDFTSLGRRARAAGFDVAGPVTQLRFLVSLGLPRMLADLASRPDAGVQGARERLALHGLMAPGGMGEVFKVMLLARGTSASALTGAKDPFR